MSELTPAAQARIVKAAGEMQSAAFARGERPGMIECAIKAAWADALAAAAAEAEVAALRAEREAVLAKAKTTQVRCVRCHGFGTHAYFGEAVTCGDCGGSGFRPIETAAELRALLDAPKGE